MRMRVVVFTLWLVVLLCDNDPKKLRCQTMVVHECPGPNA